MFILNGENLVKFQLFNTSILFGATSTIIIVLSVGILALIKIDNKRDRIRIEQIIGFKNKYNKIQNKNQKEINRYTKAFNNEKNDIESKINIALIIKDVYSGLIKEFNSLQVPGFLKEAYQHELNHLEKERNLYKRFSQLDNKRKLQSLVSESDLAHRNYIRELYRLEKNLKLII